MSKPDKKVQVAIIGAGSAGLSAFGEVRKKTDDLVVINAGLHGTTCARVGCMPSKVLIQAANDYHRRKKMEIEGILETDKLKIDTAQTLKFVRSLRDRFVRGVMGTVEAIGDRNIDGFATFIDKNVLEVNGQKIIADKIIIGSGTRPMIPPPLQEHEKDILTSDSVFEIEDFPKKLAVFGTGVIGLELGQAIHRLGVDAQIYGRSPVFAGLSDPEINDYTMNAFKKELPIILDKGISAKRLDDGRFEVTAGGETKVFDQILSAIGRRLNTDKLGLDKIGVKLNDRGLPNFNRNTMQVEDLPIYIAGDINDERSLLHEASDEGKIAGYNAVRKQNHSFERSTVMSVTFSDPEIAYVGSTYADLKAEGKSFETGQVTFEGQGRSIVMQKECGLLNIYGEKDSGRILGAEMVGPHVEHLAHLVTWSIEQKLSVFDVVKFPFYHPVVEEGLRTALRDLAKKVDTEQKHDFELRPLF